MAQDIVRFYRTCNPTEPLIPGDPRYVSFEGVRGSGDLVTRCATALRFSDMPIHLLFTGHRGGGKSTELLRLKQQLENPPEDSEKFFVVYFEADETDVDVNDVDFPDLLLAIIRHVAHALREREKIELRPVWLSRFWDDLKDLLGSKVEFESVEWDAKIAKFSAAIKSSPNERHKIREALEPNVSNLIQAANDMLTEAATRLKAAGYRDLILIVDNLDRIVLRNVPNSEFNTHEQLFINRGAQLAQINCYAVYTLPISLVFSPKATTLHGIFGRHSDLLPMVKVVDQEGVDHPSGMEAMRRMVRRRLVAAEVEESEAFDASGTLDHLCRMSGGHTRNLLILLRSACEWSGRFPITIEFAWEAVRQLSNDFERALNKPDYYETLRQIEQSHALPGSDCDQLLLYNLSVLEYMNGETWYAVNPAVKVLDKFKPKRTRSRAQG